MHTVRCKRLIQSCDIVGVGKLIGVNKAVADIVVLNPAIDLTAKIVLLLCPCQVAFFPEKVSFVAVPRRNFGKENFNAVFVCSFGKKRISVRHILCRNNRHLSFHADNIRMRDVVDADFDDDCFYARLTENIS